MNTKVAAHDTLKVMNKPDWHKETLIEKNNDRPAADYDHIEWMLNGIIDGYIQHEKAHRWLSWAQGVIYCCQTNVNLTTFKDINKQA